MAIARIHVRAWLVGLGLVLVVAAFSLDYTVQRGDTLQQIARDNDVSLADLVAVNELRNPDLIFPGQVLVIPGSGSRSDSIVYTVGRGDTLAAIAKQHGVSVEALVQLNSLVDPNLIFPRQELRIPAAPEDSPDSKSRPPTTARSGRFHIVARGESVASIAAGHDGTTAADIIKANGIVDGVIYSGSRLFLDGPGYVAPGSESESRYRVRAGDRLADIARSHGVSVGDLVKINDIANPNLIRAGSTLTIPGVGSWICPVEGARFINSWGFPRDGGSRYHEGLDLFASRGTPVRAPTSGTVEFTKGPIGGLGFRLYARDGVRYFGTHLDRYGSDGNVAAGDIIGYVGNTGNATGSSPQLHFGMALDGTVINAYPTLVAHGCSG